MATLMRTTAAVSLILALASPSRVHSAQLPVPVACFERCPISDADCMEGCRREIIETESGGGGGGGGETGEEFPKRPSAFVRIGRPGPSDKRASSFIRIGRKESPVEVLDESKRKDSFVRIGRASAFVRIGRGRQFPDLDDPKRASAFVRIGKSAGESPIEIETTGGDKDKRKSSSFIRIGRRDMAEWIPRRQR